MRLFSRTVILSLTMFGVRVSQAQSLVEREEPRQEAQEFDFHADIFPHLILQPAYLFLQLNLHEGSHALTSLAFGQDIVAYKPYPHYEDVGGERVFYFGSTLVSSEGMTSREDAVITIMPTVADMMVFVTADLALLNMERGSRVAPFVFFGGMVWPWIDFMMNVNSFDPLSDVSLWSENVVINRYGVAIVGNVLGGIGFWRILDQSVNVLLVPKAKSSNKTSLLVWPVVTNEVASFALIGRF